VNSETWFQNVDASVGMTSSAADPLNLKPQAARLGKGRNLFSNRVVEEWNLVPREIKKNARSVQSFKRAYKNHRAEMVKTA
jgi:hypothetical protein